MYSHRVTSFSPPSSSCRRKSTVHRFDRNQSRCLPLSKKTKYDSRRRNVTVSSTQPSRNVDENDDDDKAYTQYQSYQGEALEKSRSFYDFFVGLFLLVVISWCFVFLGFIAFELWDTTSWYLNCIRQEDVPKVSFLRISICFIIIIIIIIFVNVPWRLCWGWRYSYLSSSWIIFRLLR